MKFITQYKLSKHMIIICTLLLINVDLSLSIKVFSKQEDIEVQPLNLTILCNGTEVAAGIVLIKTEQKIQNVNGTNKNFGSFSINLENANVNLTNHFLNFGSIPNKKSAEIDFRLIQTCRIDVFDDGSKIKVDFNATTKDSLNPAISNLILSVSKSKNKIDDIQKYFTRASELCKSTQKWAEELKNKLITRLTQLISMIPSNKKVKPKEVNDPSFKMKLEEIENKINEINNKTAQLNDEKKVLNSDIIRLQREIDEITRNLVILRKQQELTNTKSESAKKAIEDAEKKLKETETTIKETNEKLITSNNKTISIKSEINTTSFEANFAKGKVNTLQNEINSINSEISEIESKITMEQQNLTNLSMKKNQLIKEITLVQNNIFEKGQTITTLTRELQILQNDFNGQKTEQIRIDRNVREFQDKIDELVLEQNKIPSNRQSEFERQKTTETELKASLESVDKSIIPITKEVVRISSKSIGDIINQAYSKIIDPNNFDIGAVEFILEKIPKNVWTAKRAPPA